MTEKQRWLLVELNNWQTQQLKEIGTYAPKRTPKEPTAVRSARRTITTAAKVIKSWETEKIAPWKQAKESIEQRHAAVRRIILFEKTEVALKAIKELR